MWLRGPPTPQHTDSQELMRYRKASPLRPFPLLTAAGCCMFVGLLALQYSDRLDGLLACWTLAVWFLFRWIPLLNCVRTRWFLDVNCRFFDRRTRLISPFCVQTHWIESFTHRSPQVGFMLVAFRSLEVGLSLRCISTCLFGSSAWLGNGPLRLCHRKI